MTVVMPDDHYETSLPTKEVDGVLVRIPDGFPNEAQCPDCDSWYPWFEQEFCCPGCGWIPPAKRWMPHTVGEGGVSSP